MFITVFMNLDPLQDFGVIIVWSQITFLYACFSYGGSLSITKYGNAFHCFSGHRSAAEVMSECMTMKYGTSNPCTHLIFRTQGVGNALW